MVLLRLLPVIHRAHGLGSAGLCRGFLAPIDARGNVTVSASGRQDVGVRVEQLQAAMMWDRLAKNTPADSDFFFDPSTIAMISLGEAPASGAPGGGGGTAGSGLLGFSGMGHMCIVIVQSGSITVSQT